MQKMFRGLGTPADKKTEMAIPNAENHVIGSSIRSKDYKSVEEGCNKFAVDILKLNPVN